MKKSKISIAIAEDKKHDREIIIKAIKETSNFEVGLIAEDGRELITKLSATKKQPQLILMDMQMPCCDGLLASIVCKRMLPNIKISGLSSHTDAIVVDEFIAEGGDAFLAKEMLIKGSIIHRIYNDEDIFEKSLHQIISSQKLYFDPLLNYDESSNGYAKLTTTTQVLTKQFKHLKDTDILYLQLNAAGFEREKIAVIMHKSLDTIKLYAKAMFRLFEVDNHIDLTGVCLNLGIVKFVRLYQPHTPQSFKIA